MSTNSVRVRFAPSPTGMMHLGNVRTALLNYLFAQQKQGTFIIRIEDTDPERNFDPAGKQLLQDLAWLGLSHDEGPGKDGAFGPYYQSERNHLYQEHLDILKQRHCVYRCFCTPETLDKKRQRAIALKQPPRYDRACLALSQQQIDDNLAQAIPFIWRFKIPDNLRVSFTDLAHGLMNFDLHNFSDFPLNRADGSFTFIFANCIDDIHMKITHVLRGEDHLSNTANQIALYQAFNALIPTFWHLPIICNVEGKKLSKRDFGFSLNDLRNGGFLPEAIDNYLAIIGASFEQEIMDLPTLAKTFNFDGINATGNIKYDVEKLRWVNHKWINKYTVEKLIPLVKSYIDKAYPSFKNLDALTQEHLIKLIQGELIILEDSVPALNFYFEKPTITLETILEHVPQELHAALLPEIKKLTYSMAEPYINSLKEIAQKLALSNKTLFTVIRLALTGASKGPGLKDILEILGTEKVQERLAVFK